MRVSAVAVVAVLLGAAASAAAAPAPPSAVEAAASGPSTVRVFWNPSPGATGYVVTRDGVDIGRAGAEAREFTDTAAEAGHTYVYSVAALAADGSRAEGAPYAERTFAALPDVTRCDVLVVGATTAGVAAAVTAARYGLNVVLTEESRRLGGMPANGLGATDLRRLEDSSGLFEEFRLRVRALYGEGDGLAYEPRVAQQAIKAMVWAEPRLVVHRQVRPVKVVKRGDRIAEVVAEELPSGRRVRFLPRLVVDATECGDVAAWSGAPYRVGREPHTRREPHAGYLFYDRAGDEPLPGSTGRGDRRLQAYAYLMTVKDYGPGADRTIPKPDGYDPHKYEHAPRFDASWAVSSGKLPNDKFEVNQHPQGSDLQVVNYGYPEASYAERRRIEKLYRDHALGYLYYVQTVEGKRSIGLSDDDYRDSDGWPSLLYIREARRFEGDRVLDETDIAGARRSVRPDAIGLGDYPMDSHATQPKTDWSTPDMGEGEFYLPQWTPWHQAPYRAMIPRKVANLFVPTAVSATHVAYGTLRLEPVRMHFGEAAGIACHLCLRYDVAPRDVPVRQIQDQLLKHEPPTPERAAGDGIGSPGPSAQPTLLYKIPEVRPGAPRYEAIHWLAARGFYPSPAPAKRTPSTVLTAAPLDPSGSCTVADALRLLGLLEQRVPLPGYPSAYVYPVRSVSDWEAQRGAVLTRGLAARLLARFMGWQAPAGAHHYADLQAGSPEATAAEALYATWIDSRTWDYERAYAPGGLLRFQADKPLTRAELAHLVYLAHIHIGPAWDDHPVDRAPTLSVEP